MPTFSQLLKERCSGFSRPTATEAVGAILLDASGLTPVEVERNRVVVRVHVDTMMCVKAALLRMFKGRIHDENTLQKLVSSDVPLDDRIAIFVGGWFRLVYWMPTIGENSMGCVIVVEMDDVVEKDVVACIKRDVSTPEFSWETLADAIRLATGDSFLIRETDVRGATVDDLRSSLGTRSTAKEAVETLLGILAGRKAKQAEVDAKKAADAENALYGGTEIVGVAAERVVKRLSEMTGFGPAGEWGMMLAQDVRDYKSGEISWSDVDKGCLLVGPPGSGKTTFAKALAAECEIELVSTNYNEWQGSYGGDSMAKGLTKLFEKWRGMAADAPILLFIDEIDSIGARGINGNNEAWFVTIINAWLAFLDGAVPRSGVIVLAATNHLDRVDTAMRRPGRLDRTIELPYPGIEALGGIIRHHLGADAQIDENDLKKAARACRGRSPADIEQLCRDARGLCRRIYKRRVTALDVVDVIGAMRLANARPRAVEESVAVHEAGHAVVAIALGIGVDHADIDSGHMQLTPGRSLHHRAGVEDDMVVSLAGVAAERIVLGYESTSGGADMQSVTEVALLMHAKFGMGAAGHVVVDGSRPMLGTPMHAALRSTTDEMWDRAMVLCRRHSDNIRRVADRLKRDRYLEGSEIREEIRSPLHDLRLRSREIGPEDGMTPLWAPTPPRPVGHHGWGHRRAA